MGSLTRPITANDRARPLPKAADDGPRLVVQAWLGSRLVLIAVALWVALTTGRSATDLLANWDVQHFFAISRDGYAAANDVAFFPGWPLLLAAFGKVGIPPLVAGLVLASAGSALAAVALYRLGGPVAATAWLLLPTTVFTFVPYTEAVFCAAAFWAWERALAKHWAAAASLAALACTVRVSGAFLLVALLVLVLAPGSLRPGPVPWSERRRALGWLVLPGLTLAAYPAYLYLTTGSWLAWFTAQSTGWARGLTWPWESLQHTIEAAGSTAYPAFPEWSWVFRAELGSMVLGLLVTMICLARRRWAEATWVGLQVAAFSVSYWFFSVNRAVLLWFPVVLLIAAAARAKLWSRPGWRAVGIWAGVAASGLALVVLAGWAWLFYTGRWAS